MLVLKLSKSEVSTFVTLRRLSGWYQEWQSSPSSHLSLMLELFDIVWMHVIKNGVHSHHGRRMWGVSLEQQCKTMLPTICTEHLTPTTKSNADSCDSQPEGKKQPKAQFHDSCTTMLVGEESIFYLLFMPCNMWKKERAITTGLCVCYFFLLRLKPQEKVWKMRTAKYWFLSPPLKVSLIKKFPLFLCISCKQWWCSQHMWHIWISEQRKKNGGAGSRNKAITTALLSLSHLSNTWAFL